MRIIIKTDYDDASEWVSEYILQKITTMKPCDDDLDLAIAGTNKCVELHK